jgi:hypothetical protein
LKGCKAVAAEGYSEQVLLLAEAMGDHGRHITESHANMGEIADAGATRAEQMDEVVLSLDRLLTLLKEVAESTKEDEKKIDSGIVTISREKDEVESTVRQVHATLDGARNSTAMLAEGQADIVRVRVARGIESLKLSRGGAAEALDKLGMLQEAVKVLGSTALTVKDEVVEMGAFAIEALDDLRYAGERAESSSELLEQYGKVV